MDAEVKPRVERRNLKPNNIVTVPTTLDTGFFKWWCVFLRPFIHLTEREIDVMASLLKQRYELSKIIKDSSVLDTMTMSNDTLSKVIEECKITKPHFYVVMSSLKKKGIVNGSINPRLIPNLKSEGMFKLTILFKDSQQT